MTGVLAGAAIAARHFGAKVGSGFSLMANFGKVARSGILAAAFLALTPGLALAGYSGSVDKSTASPGDTLTFTLAVDPGSSANVYLTVANEQTNGQRTSYEQLPNAYQTPHTYTSTQTFTYTLSSTPAARTVTFAFYSTFFDPTIYMTVNVTAASPSSAQTISFGAAPSNPTVGGSYQPSATASSGLAVTLTIDASTSANCSISGGIVHFNAVGSCSVNADQSGGTNNGTTYSAAARVQQSFTIGKVSTTVALQASSATPVLGQPVTLTATVSQSGATGTITFKDGAAVLGTVTVSGGSAHLAVSSLTAAAHNLTAVYSGDATYAAATSAGLTVTPTRTNPVQNRNVNALTTTQLQSQQQAMQKQTTVVQARIELLHGDGEQDSMQDFLSGISVRPSGTAGPMNYAASDPLSGSSPALGEIERRTEREPAPRASPVAGRLSEASRFHFWTAGDIILGTDTTDPTQTVKSRTQSMTVGVDSRISPVLKMGVAVGAFTSKATFGTDGTRSNSTTWVSTLYSSWNVIDTVFVDTQAGLGDVRMRMNRFDQNATGLLTGARHGSMLFGSLSLSWDRKAGAWKYAPYGRLDVSRTALDAYSEQGDANWALNYDRLNVTSEALVLGLRGQYDFAFGRQAMISPTLRFEYRHGISGNGQQLTAYAADPTTNYAVSLPTANNDSVTTGLGLKAKGESDVTGEIELLLGRSLSGSVQSQGLRGNVRVGF